MHLDLLFNFPRTRFVDENDICQQLQHLQSELLEAWIEIDPQPTEAFALEVVDIYHAAETELRILQEKHGFDIRELMHQVAEKNDARGYYNAD